MFYYSVMINYEEDVCMVISSKDELLKNTTIVVAVNYSEFAIATVLRNIPTLEALTEYASIEELILVVDLTEWNLRNENKVKEIKLNQMLDKRMDKIRREETLAKYAGRDEEFKALYSEYISLGKEPVEERGS